MFCTVLYVQTLRFLHILHVFVFFYKTPADEEKFKDNINKSINTTLNRTVVTSLTTFFVVFILSLFGGESLFPFAITLCFGIIVGTYSSIFIAAPIMMKRFSAEMEDRKKELALVEEEEENPHDPNNEGIAL